METYQCVLILLEYQSSTSETNHFLFNGNYDIARSEIHICLEIQNIFTINHVILNSDGVMQFSSYVGYTQNTWLVSVLKLCTCQTEVNTIVRIFRYNMQTCIMCEICVKWQTHQLKQEYGYIQQYNCISIKYALNTRLRHRKRENILQFYVTGIVKQAVGNKHSQNRSTYQTFFNMLQNRL